jgi:hypothetical protein
MSSTQEGELSQSNFCYNDETKEIEENILPVFSLLHINNP